MLKRLFEKIIFRHKSDSDAYIKYLRSKGAAIGERVVFYAPRKSTIDETRPWLLEMVMTYRSQKE